MLHSRTNVDDLVTVRFFHCVLLVFLGVATNGFAGEAFLAQILSEKEKYSAIAKISPEGVRVLCSSRDLQYEGRPSDLQRFLIPIRVLGVYRNTLYYVLMETQSLNTVHRSRVGQVLQKALDSIKEPRPLCKVADSRTVAIDSNGRYLAAPTSGRIDVIDLESGEKVSFPVPWTTTLQLVPTGEGGTFLALSDSGSIYWFGASNGTLEKENDVPVLWNEVKLVPFSTHRLLALVSGVSFLIRNVDTCGVSKWSSGMAFTRGQCLSRTGTKVFGGSPQKDDSVRFFDADIHVSVPRELYHGLASLDITTY